MFLEMNLLKRSHLLCVWLHMWDARHGLLVPVSPGESMSVKVFGLIEWSKTIIDGSCFILHPIKRQRASDLLLDYNENGLIPLLYNFFPLTRKLCV